MPVGIAASLMQNGIEESNASVPCLGLTCFALPRRVETTEVMDLSEDLHVSVDLRDPSLGDMEDGEEFFAKTATK